MEKEVGVTPKVLYQLLICACRYGYMRNNHLMPDGAFLKCKELLPKQFQVDQKMALHTARQLCEECISDELLAHFYSGDEDSSGNRQKAINFVYWLMTWIREHGDDAFKPFCYDRFLENVAIDDKPQYTVKELFGFNFETKKWSSSKTLNKGKPLSKNEYLNFIIEDVCGLKDGSVSYNKIDITRGERDFWRGVNTKLIYRLLFEKPRSFLIEKQRLEKKK